MVENDNFTYHVKKSQDNQKNIVDHSLITRERAQKLELLIHLISNSSQALVVCGPVGIGKTTLLKVLQERKITAWLYCPIQGNADLDFEKIRETVSQSLKQDKSVHSATRTLEQREGLHKKMVLMIDEAGLLVPGLISKIIQYAAARPALRVIFVLTHDDLYVKNRTDSVIEDCYLIEIPPLSEKQCGEFLQYLSTKYRAYASLNSINESMVETIYRETHGIPGKIIAEVPSIGNSGKRENSLWLLIAAVAGLVAVALGIQWFSSSENNVKKISTPSTENIGSPPSVMKPSGLPVQKNAVVSEQHLVEETIQYSADLETGVKNKPDAMLQPLIIDQVPKTKQVLNDVQGDAVRPQLIINNVEPSTPGNQETIPPKQKYVEAAPVPEEKKIEIATDQSAGLEWFSTQPVTNYTLQVMALSKEQSIINVLKKYQALSYDLKYIKIISHGKEKFVLYYGSFANTDLANKAKQSLPPEFSHSLVKKISAIKK